MFNLIAIEGRLVKDPETRRTPSGLAITKITLACDRTVKREGKPPLYIDATFFGNQADNIAKYFRKGKAITVTGRLENDIFESKQNPGEKKTVFYINATSFEFPLGGEKGGAAPQQGGGVAQPQNPAPAPIETDDGDLDFDDDFDVGEKLPWEK